MKVFLGGTCNDTTWRKELISLLEIDYFNPVVEDWNSECMAEEIRQRSICDYVLYCITPYMTGVYSIAELVDDSNKNPSKTIFCCLISDNEKCFNKSQWKSLMAVKDMIIRNGGIFFDDLYSVSEYLNQKKAKAI